MSNNNGKKKDPTKSSTSSTSFSWGAKVHTLNSINDFSNYTNSSASASDNSSSSSNSSLKIQHIPNLPSAPQAQQILQRIRNEFETIIQRRGYNITSITEMCCCDDGFNYLQNSQSSGNNNKRKRKIKNMPNNVLGYNLTSGNRHRIHLRLRPPTKDKHHSSSSFYPYEDIAGTMCHELAHCEISPHNAKFYKLMDEIMEQYELSLVNGGFVMDKAGFPMNSSQAYALGTSGVGGVSSGTASSYHKGDAAGKAAQLRWEQRKKFGLGGTYILGCNEGRGASGTKNNISSSLKNLPPKEAARIAAERRIEERRRNDSKYCLPCEDIIEILDDNTSDEDDNNTYNKNNNSNNNVDSGNHVKIEINNDLEVIVIDDDENDFILKTGGSSDTKTRVDVIDLSSDSPRFDKGKSSSNMCSNRNENTKKKMTKDTHPIKDGIRDDSTNYWTCRKCTYRVNRELALSCLLCGLERMSTNNDNATQREINKIVRQDFIDDVKRQELERSKRDFNGFNIYGNNKQSSSTMDHLT